MFEKTTIARPYAKAAFEIAAEEGAFKSWSELLQVLALAVVDPQMSTLLHSPRVTDEQLLDIVNGLIGESPSDSQQRFIRLLIANSRLQFAPQIEELFEQSRLDAEGMARVKVISAHSLHDAQQEKIKAAMTRRLNKQIELSADTDESLIGGAVIRYGDSVIDASIRGQLEALRNQLH